MGPYIVLLWLPPLPSLLPQPLTPQPTKRCVQLPCIGLRIQCGISSCALPSAAAVAPACRPLKAKWCACCVAHLLICLLLSSSSPTHQVVMVGDGITDLEAVQESGGADMFVGFGGERMGIAFDASRASAWHRLRASAKSRCEPALVDRLLAERCTRLANVAGCAVLQPHPATFICLLPNLPLLGIVERPVVKASADWFVTSLDALRDALPRYRVAMIGSGARQSCVR